jgi:hypothetical protein
MADVVRRSAARRGETVSRSAAMRRVQRMRAREASGRSLTDRQARDFAAIRRSAASRAGLERRRQRSNRPLQVRVSGQLYKSPGVRRHRADEHRDITFEIQPEVAEDIAEALRRGDDELAEELFEEALADDYYDLSVGEVDELEGEWEE